MSPSKGQREPWPLKAAKRTIDPDFDFDFDGCLAPTPERHALPGVACNAWLKLLGVFIQIAIEIGIIPLIAADGLILDGVAGVTFKASSVSSNHGNGQTHESPPA